MHIFIDESGLFVPATPGSSAISMVGALIVPEHKLRKLFTRYSRLRQNLPKSGTGEVKGSRLSEIEVSAVIDLLFKNSCIFEAVVMDMGWESQEGIIRHRDGQAERITAHLTPEHQPELIKGVRAWRQTLEHMQPQLYAQSAATFELLSGILERVPLYYVQRWPVDLTDFHWHIDGKEVFKLTSAEAWWSETMLPMLQSKSLRKPMLALEGADYSYFDAKYRMETPEHLRTHGFSEESGINLRRLMKDSFRFSSDAEPGLELVDIVTNATRRALLGKLGKLGWKLIPRLMLHRHEHYLSFVTLTNAQDSRPKPPWAQTVVQHFASGGRSMVTPGIYASSE